jgi:site-specific recombinase XerD
LTYIICQYANVARALNPELIPDKISPHTFRHSKAMHLLQAGVNLVYIRDLMGHVSIQTTEIYARADSKQKREALEKAYANVIPVNSENARWEREPNLKTWLKNFSK